MNKSDLAAALAVRTRMSKLGASRVVDALFGTDEGLIVEGLTRDGRVEIRGFGTFESKRRKARTLRNPRTGETITIAASKVPAFRAARGLKNLVRATPPEPPEEPPPGAERFPVGEEGGQEGDNSA